MNSDIHGSAEYRAHLVAVLARRAVAEANADASLLQKVADTVASVLPGAGAVGKSAEQGHTRGLDAR